jgi:hypothetical protein
MEGVDDIPIDTTLQQAPLDLITVYDVNVLIEFVNEVLLLVPQEVAVGAITEAKTKTKAEAEAAKVKAAASAAEGASTQLASKVAEIAGSTYTDSANLKVYNNNSVDDNNKNAYIKYLYLLINELYDLLSTKSVVEKATISSSLKAAAEFAAAKASGTCTPGEGSSCNEDTVKGYLTKIANSTAESTPESTQRVVTTLEAFGQNCFLDSYTPPQESSQSQDGGARDSDEISMLGGDPLFLVLSEFFMTKGGKNIADVLEEINQGLKEFQSIPKKKGGKWPF